MFHTKDDLGPAEVQPIPWHRNGITKARGDVPVCLVALNEVWRHVVPRNSPDAIAKGARCVDHGYASHWPAGSMALYFVTRPGSAVHVTVGHYIPLLDLDSMPVPAAMGARGFVEHDEIPAGPAARGGGAEPFVGDVVRQPQDSDGMPDVVLVVDMVEPPEAELASDGLSEADPAHAKEGGFIPEARRDLQAAALSLRHPPLHGCMNPYGESCKDTAVRRKQNRRNVAVPESRSFGDRFAMDHVSANARLHNGLDGEFERIVVSDLAAGYLGVLPMVSKTAGCALSSLVRYLGHARAKAL